MTDRPLTHTYLNPIEVNHVPSKHLVCISLCHARVAADGLRQRRHTRADRHCDDQPDHAAHSHNGTHSYRDHRAHRNFDAGANRDRD